MKLKCIELRYERKKIAYPCVRQYMHQLEFQACGSVDVRSSQMMIWLTGVSRADLTVPRLRRAERQSPLLLLPRPSWLFLMRQEDRELSLSQAA